MWPMDMENTKNYYRFSWCKKVTEKAMPTPDTYLKMTNLLSESESGGLFFRALLEPRRESCPTPS